MAYCNTSTGKIVGAKEGTFEYFHEEGHLEYNNSEKGISDSFKMQNYLIFAVTTMPIIALWKYFAIVPLLMIGAYWYYYLEEERFCDNYANDKLKELEEKK